MAAEITVSRDFRRICKYLIQLAGTSILSVRYAADHFGSSVNDILNKHLQQ